MAAEITVAASPAEKTWQTHLILNDFYGVLDLRRPRRSAMHELISTMLSHRTTHANEEIAYYRMRELYPTWPEVITAPVEDLTKALKQRSTPAPKP